MFIGGNYVPELHLAEAKIRKYKDVVAIGVLLLLTLSAWTVVIGAIDGVFRGAIDVKWFDVPTFLSTVVILTYIVFLILWITVSVTYGYGWSPKQSGKRVDSGSDRELSGSTLTYLTTGMVLLIIIMAGMLIGMFSRQCEKFIQICQESPTHPFLILPLGIVVIYMTWVGCKMVQVLWAWWQDYRAWKMARNLFVGWDQDGMSASAETEGNGEMTFRGFVKILQSSTSRGSTETSQNSQGSQE